MEFNGKQLGQVLRKDQYVYIFAFIFLMVAFFIAKPLYETNDDMFIIAVLSGQYGSGLSTDPMLISPLLGNLLTRLYEIQPQIPWYSLNLYCFLLISIFIGLRIITSVYKDSAERWLIVLAFLSLYMYVFVRLNFASSSLMVWFMVCSYACLRNLKGRAASNKDVLLGLLLVGSYLIRPDIITLGLVFTLPLLVTLIRSGEGKRRLLYMVIPLVLVISLSSFASAITNSTGEISHRELQATRSHLLNTKAGDFNQNTLAALRQVDWTLADYKLLQLWWTHDEVVFSDEKMKAFSHYNQPEDIPLVSLISLNRALGFIFSTGYFLLIVFLVVIPVFLRPHSSQTYNVSLTKSWPNKMALAVIGAEGIMICALILIRAPERIALPLYIYFLIVLILMRPFINMNWQTNCPGRISIIVFALISTLSIGQVLALGTDGNNKLAVKSYTNATIEQVKQQKGNDTIIVNLTPIVSKVGDNPFVEYRNGDSYNYGSEAWLVGSPIYYEYLQRLGLQRGKDFCDFAIDNPRVVFAFWQKPGQGFAEYSNYVLRYYQEHSGVRAADEYQIEVLLDKPFSRGNNETYGWVYFQMASTNK